MENLDPALIIGFVALVGFAGTVTALIVNSSRISDRFRAQGVKEGRTDEQITTLNREVRDIKKCNEDQVTANGEIMRLLGKIDAQTGSIGQRLQRIEDKEDRRA